MSIFFLEYFNNFSDEQIKQYTPSGFMKNVLPYSK